MHYSFSALPSDIFSRSSSRLGYDYLRFRLDADEDFTALTITDTFEVLCYHLYASAPAELSPSHFARIHILAAIYKISYNEKII